MDETISGVGGTGLILNCPMSFTSACARHRYREGGLELSLSSTGLGKLSSNVLAATTRRRVGGYYFRLFGFDANS